MSHHAFFAFSILTQKTNFVFQSFDYSVSIVLFSLIKTSFSTAETEIKNILTLQEKYTRVYPLSDSAGIYIVKTLETHALIQRLLPGISFDVIKPNDSNHRVWVNLVFSILDPSLNLDSFVPSSSSSSSSFSSSSSSSFSFSFLQSLSSDALLEKQKKEFLNTNQIQIITESDNKNYAAHTNLENYVYFTNEKDAFYKLPVGDAKTAFVNKWKRIFCNTGWLQPTKAWLVKLTAEFNHFFKEKEITIKELKFSFHNYKNAQINKSLTLFLNFLSRGVVDTTQQQFKSFLEQFSSDPFFKSIEEKSLYDKTEIASLLFSRFKSRKVLQVDRKRKQKSLLSSKEPNEKFNDIDSESDEKKDVTEPPLKKQKIELKTMTKSDCTSNTTTTSITLEDLIKSSSASSLSSTFCPPVFFSNSI